MPKKSKPANHGIIYLSDIPIETILKSFQREGEIRKKRLKEAFEACKKTPIPKRFFRHFQTEPKSYFEKFRESDDEIFYCHQCKEPYYLNNEYYDGYIEKDECIPVYCEFCGFRMDIHPRIEWFGNWAVTLYGVESLNHNYIIHYTRLNLMDWISHMEEKNWVSLIFFAQALTYAKMFFYPDQFLPSYQKYLRSPHWKTIKQQALDFYGNRCVLCNSSTNLNVHHRNYDHLSNEVINKDLIVLCRDCHGKFHNKD